jgi:anti-sigma B factor antagonist
MPVHPPGPSLEIARNSNHIVVRLVGCKSLHEDNVHIVDGEVASLVEEREGQHLVLDLAAVEYLTSSALGKLVALHRRLRQQGGRLTVTNARDAVWEVFAVTRLNQVLEIQPAPGSDTRVPDGLSA